MGLEGWGSKGLLVKAEPVGLCLWRTRATWASTSACLCYVVLLASENENCHLIENLSYKPLRVTPLKQTLGAHSGQGRRLREGLRLVLTPAGIGE